MAAGRQQNQRRVVCWLVYLFILFVVLVVHIFYKVILINKYSGCLQGAGLQRLPASRLRSVRSHRVERWQRRQLRGRRGDSGRRGDFGRVAGHRRGGGGPYRRRAVRRDESTRDTTAAPLRWPAGRAADVGRTAGHAALHSAHRGGRPAR